MNEVELIELEKRIPKFVDEDLIVFLLVNWSHNERLFRIAIYEALDRNLDITKIVLDIESDIENASRFKAVLIEGILSFLAKYDKERDFKSMVFILGLALVVVNYLATINWFIYIIACCSVGFGIVKTYLLKSKTLNLIEYLNKLHYQKQELPIE